MMLNTKTQAIHQLRQLTHNAFGLAQCQQALVQTHGDVHQARALLVNDPKKPSVLDHVAADAPPLWAYLITKVVHYQRVGCDIYRKHDAFGMPLVSWDPETLQEIESCFEQFLQGKGYQENHPVEGISIGGFYAALTTLHFEMVEQSAVQRGEYFIDAILFAHRVEGNTLELFNKVPCEPDLENRFPDDTDIVLHS
jgi:hypothetical protein